MLFKYMEGPRFDGLYDDVFPTGVYSREAIVDQNYTSGALTGLVVFAGPATINNNGSIPISVDADNFTFRNNASYKATYQISYTVTWNPLTQNQGIKQAWISKNLQFNDRYGITSIHQASNVAQVLTTSATLVLEPNETFGIRVYQNTGSITSIDGSSQDRCKIQITQIK